MDVAAKNPYSPWRERVRERKEKKRREEKPDVTSARRMDTKELTITLPERESTCVRGSECEKERTK